MDYLDLYNFQTSNGIVVPSTDTVLESVRERFKDIFGADIDLSPETPVGRLIEAFAVLVKSATGVTAQSANQFCIEQSTGPYLDALGGIFGLKRRVSSRTSIRVQCTFSSENGRAPAGSQIMNPSTRDSFRIDQDITAEQQIADGNYLGYGTATAVDPGLIPAEPGTITAMTTREMTDWIAVTNTQTLRLGSLLESDAAFRERIKKARATGVGFRPSLESRLLRSEHVYSCCVLENNNSETAVVRGVPMKGHSVFVCAYTGSQNPGEQTQREIAEAIVATKPAGTGIVTGDDEAAEIVEYGGAVPHKVEIHEPTVENALAPYKTEVVFFSPKMVQIQMTIYLTAALYTGLDFAKDIRAAATDYVESTEVGGTLYSAMLAQAILASVSGFNVKTIELSRVDGTETSDTAISVAGYQKMYVDYAHIDIVDVSKK